MPAAATIIDPSIPPTEHCHEATTHLLGMQGPGAAALVFIGPASSAPVLVGDAYISANVSCGDTDHEPIVTGGSTNVLVGPSLIGMSFSGAALSCGDKVGANEANKVFVN